MSSTAKVATRLDIVKQCFSGETRFTWGVSALSTGTVELDTGLSQVHGVICMCLGSTDTETVCFRLMEDVPTSTGTVTIDGTKLDEGAAVANAGSEQFFWLAFGV